MSKGLICWKCGAALAATDLPLARLAECRACGAELHVCRLCECFDSRVAGACLEDRAEPPQDKTRANFCDYFSPCPNAYRPREAQAAAAAKAELEALFGEAPAPAAAAPTGEDGAEAERARRELERLFGDRG